LRSRTKDTPGLRSVVVTITPKKKQPSLEKPERDRIRGTRQGGSPSSPVRKRRPKKNSGGSSAQMRPFAQEGLRNLGGPKIAEVKRLRLESCLKFTHLIVANDDLVGFRKAKTGVEQKEKIEKKTPEEGVERLKDLELLGTKFNIPHWKPEGGGCDLSPRSKGDEGEV